MNATQIANFINGTTARDYQFSPEELPVTVVEPGEEQVFRTLDGRIAFQNAEFFVIPMVAGAHDEVVGLLEARIESIKASLANHPDPNLSLIAVYKAEFESEGSITIGSCRMQYLFESAN